MTPADREPLLQSIECAVDDARELVNEGRRGDAILALADAIAGLVKLERDREREK